MTAEEVATQMLCSPTKVSRMETGQRGVSLSDVRELCRIYGISGQPLAAQLMALAKEARQPGYRQEWSDFSPSLDTHVDLETSARLICEFQPAYIPSLLQTEDYARTLIRQVLPRITPTTLEQRLHARMERQKRLTEPDPPRYWALVDEAVLLRTVGSDEIMRAQLEHLLEMAELSHVTVQIIPFTVGAYMCLDNPFVFFDLGEPMMPAAVYVELAVRGEYLEKPDEVSTYREAVDRIRASGLDPQASKNRIAARIRELPN